MSQNTPTHYPEDEIDLKALFTLLWSKKAIITAITATSTILAAIYAFSKTPIYEARPWLKLATIKRIAVVAVVAVVVVIVVAK